MPPKSMALRAATMYEMGKKKAAPKKVAKKAPAKAAKKAKSY